ncbi:rubrerythrin [Leptospira wolffii]|uniref:ferritin-like domain-containing protein n=1 Tax=Leptospira wolffii TaxID=409998 RepID=UPI001083F528|nr:ferritin family protein [Leptospira wolffii]TGK59401.1 rubrerythrin [Leptospira wolffii]TGK71216.1 rubrerythrin [Leptospira wolffii]TGK77784.1 rubrerythrin [Leptospira wolffii]TGL29506.1 rubrerythrin [Leptospira wolffii]
MTIKPLKETTFLEAIAAAIQHEKDYFEFYMNTYEKLPPGRTRELFEKLAEEVDEHIKFIQEIYESAEGAELPNLKQLAAIHKFHQSTIQKIMHKVERTIIGTASKDAHEALELAIREAENAVAFYEKLSTKFDDPNIKSLFTKLMEYNNNYQSLLEAELNSFDQTSSGGGAFFWDEQAEEVAKAVQAPSKTKAAKSLKPGPSSKKPAPKKAAKKAAPKKKAVAKKKTVAKKPAPKKKAAAKKKR